MTEERLEELMVLAVDKLITPAQEAELSAYLKEYPALQQELEAQMGIKSTTDDWIHRLEVDIVGDEDLQTAAPIRSSSGTAFVEHAHVVLVAEGAARATRAVSLRQGNLQPARPEAVLVPLVQRLLDRVGVGPVGRGVHHRAAPALLHHSQRSGGRALLPRRSTH